MDEMHAKTTQQLQKNYEQLRIERKHLEELLDSKEQTIRELTQQKEALRQELVEMTKKRVLKSPQKPKPMVPVSPLMPSSQYGKLELKYQIPQLKEMAAVVSDQIEMYHKKK